MNITLDKFSPRSYQIPIFQAIENKGYKRAICILPRRSGKDVCAFNLLVREALRRIGNYWMVYPTYSQGRKILWDSLTNDGHRFIDYIPRELVESTNSSEMKIRLINQSVIQVVGSDNYDNLVGTNARGIVFSEYALQDPRAYQFLRPVLTHNNGFAVFITTPRGKNHAWELFQIAKANPDDWFAYRLTVEDTHHIPLAEIEKERASGEMSEDLIQQEYYCSFEMGVEGAYYTKIMDQMRVKGQIGPVPWESAYKVFTAWDLGVRDSTSIIFFQVCGNQIRIIDYYEKSKEGLEHYAKVLQSKPYVYGKHIAPHDIKVMELGSGITRLEKARQLGINFTVAPDVSISDGIECVRSNLGKMWIDDVRCASLIKALENYRQEWDEKKRVYKGYPLHNWASHAADAMRYLCISLSKTRDGLTSEELDQKYREHVYGDRNILPPMFRDGQQYY